VEGEGAAERESGGRGVGPSGREGAGRVA